MSQNSLNETAGTLKGRLGRTGLWLVGAALCFGAIVQACSSDPSATDNPVNSSSSSGGSSTSSGSGGSPDGGPDAVAPDEDAAVPDATGDLKYIPVDPGDAEPGLVCNKNAVVFNLTELGPDGMSQAFVDAWDYEVGNPVVAGRPPAIVLAAKGLQSGPIELRIGGTKVVGGMTVIPAAGDGTALVTVPYLASNKSVLNRANVPANFSIAFGPPDARKTVYVTGVSFLFTVDDNCDTLSGALSLEIPGTPDGFQANAAVAFGDGTTLGSLLGAPTVDTNNDTVLDGWTLSFSTNRGSATAIPLNF